MTIDELKARVQSVRVKLADPKRQGHIIAASENGPIGIDLIDALVKALEEQAKRIDALQRRLDA
jgi:hypothetical protein